MNEIEFPAQYEPYQRVRIGSNILENVRALVSIGNKIPLLVGNGATPRVWLSIPADKSGSRWYPLVKDNFSTNPDVKVEVSPKKVIVRTPSGSILSAICGKEGALWVQKLDLRPFGLNIFADENSLQVMGSKLSKNEFRDVSIVIGVGVSTDA
jgi:hypothetical protein